MNFFVQKSKSKNIAYISYEKKKIICYVGKNGIGKKNREGDFITPKGCFKLLKVFYKEKKNLKIKSGIPLFKIKRKFAWCVDSRHKNYNSLVQKPIHCKFEELFRNDSLYDVIIVLDYNYPKPIKYKGSAIFLHCSEKRKKFTEGCLAVKKKDLLKMIELMSPSSKLIIS